MSKKFMFNELEMQVLKNFSGISSSMSINKTDFTIKNVSNSIVSQLKFQNKYDFDSFGIYDISEFLSVLSSLKSLEIEVKEKFIEITDGSSKFKYFTTAEDFIPKVNFSEISKNYNDKAAVKLKFDMTSEKLNMIFKTASILKADYVFFETSGKRILITVANELESSNSSFEISIEEGIECNELEKPMKILVSELKIFQGDYSVEIADRISKWENHIGNLTYFIVSTIC